jgi:hypothetical protein
MKVMYNRNAMYRREARKVAIECARWKGRRHVPLCAQLQENRWKAKRPKP